MNTAPQLWTKEELQIYILLLCANADNFESKEELTMIKSKTNETTFQKIYNEFSEDSGKIRLEKIDINVHAHTYSMMELMDLRSDIHEIFFSDHHFHLLERKLDRVLDKILY